MKNTSKNPQSNILVLSDSQDFLDTLTEYLEYAGYSISNMRPDKNVMNTLLRSRQADHKVIDLIILDLETLTPENVKILRKIQSSEILTDILVLIFPATEQSLSGIIDVAQKVYDKRQYME